MTAVHLDSHRFSDQPLVEEAIFARQSNQDCLCCREHMDQVMLDVAHKCQEKGLSLEDAFPNDEAKVTSSELEAFLTEAGFDNAAETATKMVSPPLCLFNCIALFVKQDGVYKHGPATSLQQVLAPVTHRMPPLFCSASVYTIESTDTQK
jgi:hypothetical protein